MNRKAWNKKAMGVGQVFVFIISAITFALIMIFGYRSISGFLESGEGVQFVQFKNNLESSINKIYTEYGAVRLEKFSLPSQYEQICFVDLDADVNPELCAIDPIACNVWNETKDNRRKDDDGVTDLSAYESADENVFLTPISPVRIKVHQISMGGGYLCTKIVSGQFSLRLEGKGDRTFLARG